MPQMQKLSKYCTTVEQSGPLLRVVYHSTAIVTADADRITLRTGGWDTVTTRCKMTQAARQFGLGFGVYRFRGVSFVNGPGFTRRPLVDGMTFERNPV